MQRCQLHQTLDRGRGGEVDFTKRELCRGGPEGKKKLGKFVKLRHSHEAGLRHPVLFL